MLWAKVIMKGIIISLLNFYREQLVSVTAAPAQQETKCVINEMPRQLA